MSVDLPEQYGELWQPGIAAPDVFAFLDDHGGARATEMLAILLQDQQHRWKTHQPLKVEDYLARLPAVARDLDIKLELAVGEFLARQNSGPTPPSIDDFTSRFGDISDVLRSKLTELTWVGMGDDRGFTLTQSHVTESTADDQKIGRYRLVRVLGEGAFGRVYLGFDEELQRQVAIKVPTKERFQQPKDAEAYLAEARTVASLDHPNIVPVHDVGRTNDGSIYIVSKFIEGRTLADLIKHDRPTHDEAAILLATVAQALDHAHRRRLIHRDVKPSNVLIEDSTGTAYVGDFGLAIREEDYLKGSRIAGTPAYMSPEQARGEGHRLDGRSDIFAMGIVFYELLTGKRPFRGSTVNELLHQIVSVEPPHPREFDDSIPFELVRICLKSLSKRASDRYATAAELAGDLLQYQQGPEQTPRKLKIIPKGLRSFDADDADFFLDLLPGPRSREGLPESIHFWKARIEETDPDKTFRVGLIFGPSGCGKSSLMKAGLLPRLSKDVVAVYVEATPDETETRLLRGLRKQLPQLPKDLALVETFTFLRRNAGRKIVIVVDQFEQWLHTHRAEQETKLVSALRQCDGGTLQAVVMVRDDFSMAASRFMHELEARIVEAHNFATSDLFDVEHAKSVLVKFGQAFGRLPSEFGSLSDEEQEFVSAVASGLAQDGKVVSVRLALFAEMVKGKPWIPATLDLVGGTEGIGVNFLEETFSSRVANPDHYLHRQSAREVLKALLPEIGSDIKGHMRSHSELLEASGYQNRLGDFNDLLRILDGELRLITPTDPEGFQTDSGSDPGSKFYQLTHDYLVPSLRDWLTRKQKETRGGRAELLLKERVSFWNTRREKRQLPSWLEWAFITLFTHKKDWTQPQRSMMRNATRNHTFTAALAVSIMLALGWGAFEIRGFAGAYAMVQKLESAEIREVPEIIHDLAPYRRWANSLIKTTFADAAPDSRPKLNASLALLADDREQLPYLLKKLLAANPEDLLVIREALVPYAEDVKDPCWKILRDPNVPTGQRLQAACGLAEFDPANAEWPVWSSDLTAWLITEGPFAADLRARALRPISHTLLDRLEAVFLHGEKQETAALLLAEFLEDDLPPLIDLIKKTDPVHLNILTAPLKQREDDAVKLLQRELSADPPSGSEEEKDDFAKQRANVAIGLMVLGRADQVWSLLAYDADPRGRTLLTRGLADAGVDPDLLISRLKVERDESIKRSIIIGLGDYSVGPGAVLDREPMLSIIMAVYRENYDPGVHSAAEWLLRKWGCSREIQLIDEDGLTGPPGGLERPWHLNTEGHMMVVIRGPVEFSMGSPGDEAGREWDETLHRRRISRTFALASKEVTIKQFRRFLPNHSYDAKTSPREDCPVNAVDLSDAMRYCNWLSEKEELEMCYFVPTTEGEAEIKPYEDFLSRKGYRLPTEAEWECACRAGTRTSRYYGNDPTLLQEYAWYSENSDGQAWPVGRLKPNDWGFFDLLGNVREWCQDAYSPYAAKTGTQTLEDEGVFGLGDRQLLRGGSFGARDGGVRSATRSPSLSRGASYIGFRVARTWE